jgi:hypothetical protein
MANFAFTPRSALSYMQPSLKKIATALLLILAVLAGSAKAWLDHRLRNELQRTVNHALPHSYMRYEHAYVSLDGAVIVNAVGLHLPAQVQLHLGQIHIPQVYRYWSQFPSQGAIFIRDIDVQLPPARINLELLFTAAGYGDYYLNQEEVLSLLRLHGNLEGNFIHNSHDNTLTLRLILNSDSIGQWQLQLDFEEVRNLAWQNWSLRRALLNYHDNGLIARLSAHLAEKHKHDATRLRADLSARVQQNITSLGVPLSSASLAAMDNFIRQPTNLSLSAAPTKPLPLKIIPRYPLNQWPQVLGIDLSNE